MAQYKASGDMIDYTPGSATLGGAVVVQDNDLISVVISDITATGTGSAYIRGIFEFDTDETGMVIGDNAFWDAAASKITATDTDIYAGRVTKYDTAGKIDVSINYKHEVTGS